MNKKLVLLTAILVVSVGFLNGCTGSVKPDVKLISAVDIEKSDYISQYPHSEAPYNVTWTDYDVLFTVKETNNIGVDVIIQLEIQTYDDATGEWNTWSAKQWDRVNFYIDGGDETTLTLNVDDLKQDEDERKKIVIYISLFGEDNTQIKYQEVLYEEEILYWAD